MLDELWWVFLGFLSSFGLGTGLHTFVLYLGPFIAQATMAAFACGNTDFETLGEHAFHCLSQNPDTSPSFLSILLKVQAQAVAWGIGTAIGELPPYFVARAGMRMFSLVCGGTSWRGGSEVSVSVYVDMERWKFS